MKKRVEVLAPAGSFESMQAACAAGADAVYIGGARFGARAYADNLDETRMLEAIDYAHLHGMSLYMTVNTLMKDTEMDQVYAYLQPYYERGLDAVIVQDLGLFAYIRRQFPDLAIHVSTQMTSTGHLSSGLLERLGAVRVVPARELSLPEIRRIHEETGLEIECFVHGALCYSYSGQCLMSSLIGGRSGNRGRCAQPCRLPYQTTCVTKEKRKKDRRDGGKQKEEDYVLSLKDLCTLDLIPDLIEAGVHSFKIEGRMKSPRYTAGVVRIYRKYVDRYLEGGRAGYFVEDEDRRQLLELFDRGGQTDGYYRRHNGADMVVRREKPAFRQVDQAFFEELDRLYVNAVKQEEIDGLLTAVEGETLLLKLTCETDGHPLAVTVAGEICESARSQPMTADRLEKQLRKTGGSPFRFRDVQVITGGNVFVPVSALNELRRDALLTLSEEILRGRRRAHRDKLFWRDEAERMEEKRLIGTAAENAGRKLSRRPVLQALLQDPAGLTGLLAVPELQEIILEADACPPADMKGYTDRIHAAGKQALLALPVIFRTHAERFFEQNPGLLTAAGFDGLLIRNLEEAEYLRQKQNRLPVTADHHLYTWNRLAKEMVRQYAERETLPLELNAAELKERGCEGGCLVVYGALPAMVSAQCVKKTTEGCSHVPGWYFMKDRTGKSLPMYNHCTFCYNVICNPSPLSLLGCAEQIRELAPAALRLDFTRESPEEIRRIAESFVRGLSGEGEGKEPVEDYTRGHFRRGVE